MKLSNKHANAQVVSYSDFSGGLNTADAVEMIQTNELYQSENVEIYKGQLKTCSGTTSTLTDIGKTFDYVMYDRINDVLIITDTGHNVYKLPKGSSTLSSIGTLTGTSSVRYATWEDGIIIASGGKLQYFNGTSLVTLTNSNSECHDVYIKDGRVWTYYNDELHASATGDEETWAVVDNDASKGQWTSIGYKDGGKIVGMCSLSSDTIVFKNNHRAYRFSGSFPDISVIEIGRQLDCKDYDNCLSLADSVVLLGSSSVQSITTTQAYGDMIPSRLSDKIYKDVANIGTVRMRYIPSLNQVWMINGTDCFLFLDVNNGGWFRRRYNSKVVDAVDVDGTVYVLKEHSLCILDPSHMKDDGNDMQWMFQGKTLLSANQYLIKRVWVDTTPYFTNNADQSFLIGSVNISGAVPPIADTVFDNEAEIFSDSKYVNTPNKDPVYGTYDEVYNDYDYVYDDDKPIVSFDMYRAETRCVDRERAIRVLGRGSGSPMMIHSLSFQITEV